MKKRTSISDIFPVALFLIFTFSVMFFVIISVQLYRSIVKHSGSAEDTDIAARYMVEKIRSHDELGNISVTDYMGHEAVRLDKMVKDQPYVTYIYVYNGTLRELYVEESELSNCTEDSGTEILEINDMDIEKISDDLLRFNFSGNDNNNSEAIVSLKSSPRD